MGDPLILVATPPNTYIVCLYPPRFIASSVSYNKPFLNYSVVTPQHLILARICLEFMNVAVVVGIMVIIFYVMDADIVPLSMSEAAAALGAAAFFGIALGIFFAVLMSIFGPLFNVAVVILLVLLYISSLSFVPEHLITSNVREYLVYNPIYCLIKWLRSAYYPFYELDAVPRLYIVCLSFILFFLGLLGERFLRGRLVN